MPKSLFSCLSLLFLLTVLAFQPLNINAQDDGEAVVDAPVVRVGSTVAMSRSDDSDDEDDGKITGATIRGQVIYRESERPLRYALIGFIEADKEYVSEYSSKFVKTDDKGGFVIKNIKPGTYYPYIKSTGILNFSDFRSRGRMSGTKEDLSLFEKITVRDLGEMQIQVRAVRGGAISGTIRHADGEAAVGVRVEALRKTGDKFLSIPVSTSNTESVVTNDRGGYRFYGLPAGDYLIRAVEPISHSTKAQAVYSHRNSESSSLLRTYYPQSESTKDAREINIAFGQEQSDIDITLPDKQLFTVSGRIIQKKSGQPLKKFSISFFKMAEPDEGLSNGGVAAIASASSSDYTSNSQGEWTLLNLPRGKYRLTVSQQTTYDDNQNKAKEPQYPNTTKEIEITDGNLTNILIEVPLAGSISGVIVADNAKPLPRNINLFVFNIDKKTSAFGEPDYSDGENAQPKPQREFQFNRLNDGKHRITLFGDEHYIKSVTLNGTDITGKTIDVANGESVQGLRVVLSSDFGTVKGKVSPSEIPRETMVAFVKADAINDTNYYGSFGGLVKPSGDFEVKVAPGEYAAVVFSRKDLPRDSEAKAQEYFKQLLLKAPRVTVKAAETTVVNLSLTN